VCLAFVQGVTLVVMCFVFIQGVTLVVMCAWPLYGVSPSLLCFIGLYTGCDIGCFVTTKVTPCIKVKNT
jgi:uncharacterized membrane protein YqjE